MKAIISPVKSPLPSKGGNGTAVRRGKQGRVRKAACRRLERWEKGFFVDRGSCSSLSKKRHRGGRILIVGKGDGQIGDLPTSRRVRAYENRWPKKARRTN